MIVLCDMLFRGAALCLLLSQPCPLWLLCLLAIPAATCVFVFDITDITGIIGIVAAIAVVALALGFWGGFNFVFGHGLVD